MIHIALGCVISVLLLTHRFWPVSCRRSDLLFAGDHFIGDGHAKRMLDTRLGAAFTLCLPFVLGIFSVSTFGQDNVKITQALIPDSILEPRLDNINNDTLFGKLHVSLEAYSLLPNAGCAEALAIDLSLAHDMKCRSEVNQAALAMFDTGSLCSVRVTCDVGSRLAGTSSLLFSLGDTFQSIRYNVGADSWNGIDPHSLVENIMESSPNTSLAGDKSQPTNINFQLTRSRYQNKRRLRLLSFEPREEPNYYGLQLAELKAVPMESATASGTGKHYVSFNFETTGSVFTKEESDKVDLASQLSRLFTLLLSTLAFFRFVKTYVELLIDHACLYISGAKGIPVPEDVKERINILEERHEDSGSRRVGLKAGHMKGKEPSRRMSMLMSQEDATSKFSDSVDSGSIELISIENPLVKKAEEVNKVEDSDMKALVKKVLANYERMRKVNEGLRKQVADLDATVVRLVSIVKGKADDSVNKVSLDVVADESEDAPHPLPAGWQVFESELGGAYYCGPDGKTTWDPP